MLTTTDRQRLAEARVQAGLTQRELALRMGIARNTLALLEIGRRDPSYDMLKRWTAALGINVELTFSNADRS